MANLHVNHIKAHLVKEYIPYVDMSDVTQGTIEEKNKNALSRALAAYAISNRVGLAPESACKYITDGYGDNGLDLLYFDSSANNLWIVQSKFIDNGAGGVDCGDLHKFVQGIRDLCDMKYDNFNEKIKKLKVDIESALQNPLVKIQCVIAFTGKQLSKENRDVLDSFTLEFNDPTEVLVLTDFNLAVAHDILVKGMQGQLIEEDISLEEWGIIDNPYKEVYGLVSANEVASWWSNYGPRLFDENIRHFLGKSEANASIKNTLSNSPDLFNYFNNGITIICDKFVKAPLGGSKRSMGIFKVTNLNIVNGAQTVGTIGEYINSIGNAECVARVFVKIISLEGAPDGLTEKITIANNTQNKVEKKDFVSLDPIQQRLQDELILEGIKYHIKRTDVRVVQDESNYVFEECTQAMATRLNDVSNTVLAKREIGKLWENRNSKPYIDLFYENLDPIYFMHIIKVFRYIQNALAGKISALEDGREKRILTYGNLFISHLVIHKLEEKDLYNKSLSMEIYLNDSIEPKLSVVISSTIEKVNELYPNAMIPQLFRNYTKCRDLKNHILQMEE